MHGEDVVTWRRAAHGHRSATCRRATRFIAGITAVRFVRMMGELSGLPAEAALERAHETLQYVGLGEARYRTLEGFSLGMKQMAKLAQAIVHAPKILFLDEPTNGLDPPARARMIRLVKEIRDSGQAQIILLVAPAARRRGVLRRGAGPEGRRGSRSTATSKKSGGANQKFLQRRNARRRAQRSRRPPKRDGLHLRAARPGPPEAWCFRRRSPCAISTGSRAEQQLQIRRLDYKARFAPGHLPQGDGGAPWPCMTAATAATTGPITPLKHAVDGPPALRVGAGVQIAAVRRCSSRSASPGRSARTLWIYLHHNLAALANVGLDGVKLAPVNATFFAAFMGVQCFFFGGLLTLLVGPGPRLPDLANGALPLLLSRAARRGPATRSERCATLASPDLADHLDSRAVPVLSAELARGMVVVRRERCGSRVAIVARRGNLDRDDLAPGAGDLRGRARRKVVAQTFLLGRDHLRQHRRPGDQSDVPTRGWVRLRPPGADAHRLGGSVSGAAEARSCPTPVAWAALARICGVVDRASSRGSSGRSRW